MADALVKLREQFDREVFGAERIMSLPWGKLTLALGDGLRPGTLTLLVGEPGSAKTYLALALCLHAYQTGWSWAYQPYERDDTYAVRRMLAVLVNRWDVLDLGNKGNLSLLDDDEVLGHMARISPFIRQNPRQMRRDEDGNLFIPPCRYEMVLEQLRGMCADSALVVLDPLSMLSFDGDGRDAWQGQERFAKDAAALTAQYQTRLVIVHHTRKSNAGGKPRQNSLDEVAGAAALSRFADNVVFLEHHPDALESEIVDVHGIARTVNHRRTLFVAKARDGKGTGWRVACDLSENGPELVEHGFIRRKGGK